ncbi:MAG: TonB-dependent receptor [Bacteroidia bacterium]|nr:TonB-dependent receptor [Bacteroidia bacterium]
MKTILLLCLVLFNAALVNAQLLTIRDGVTREPLEQVALFSFSPRVSAVTDAKGRVDIAPFSASDSIRIEMIGYERIILSYTQLAERTPTLLLRQTAFALDEVVVSATRWKQARSEVPARMITLSRADAALQNPQTAADVLANSGEIFVQKSQLGGGSPMIRGFATNRVLLAVDGVRMNTAIFRSGNVQNVISVDPFTIERTEVLFGPGSVMYGSDALGGVMTFNTITPGFSYGSQPLLAANAITRYSSANREKTGHLGLRLGLRKWAFATTFTWSEFGDLRMGSDGPEAYLRGTYAARVDGRDTMLSNPDPEVQVPSGYTQWSVMQKIRFKPNDAWDVRYGAHYSETSDYARYDRLLRYRGTKQRSAEWNYGPQVWMMHALNATLNAQHAMFDDLHLTAAWQCFKESRHDRDFNAATRYNRTEEVDALSLNADFERNFSPADRLHYGIELLSNSIGSSGTDENILQGSIAPGPSRYPDGADWMSWAVYTDYRRILGAGVILHAGLRYNYITLDGSFDTTFYPFPFTELRLRNSALNGSLGTVYNAGGGWQFNANLSTGFRAPNVDDAGKVFDSTPGYVIVPNPKLTPEYAYNAEITASSVVSRAVKLSVTGYFTWLDDALVRRDFSFGGLDSLVYDGEMSRVQAIQNAAFAEVYGIQADMEIRFPWGLSLVSRINAQKGIEELDDGSTAPLRHAPPWFGSTHLGWKGGNLEIDLYALYNGEVAYDDLAPEERGKDYLYAPDELGRPYSPSWMTVNLKSRYRLNDTFSLSFGIENITDKRYRPYSSGITAPGRNVITSLSVRV